MVHYLYDILPIIPTRQPDPVLWSVPAKYLFLPISQATTVRNIIFGDFTLLFCEVRQKMYGNSCCTCSTIISPFLINDILALWRCRCRSRRLCLNSLMTRFRLYERKSYPTNIQSSYALHRCRDGAVVRAVVSAVMIAVVSALVRALASHQCGLG